MSKIRLITFIYTKDALLMHGEDDENELQSKELCRVAHQHDPKDPTFRATFIHNSINGILYSFTQTIKDGKLLEPNLFVRDYDYKKGGAVQQAYFIEGKKKTKCDIDNFTNRTFVGADEHLFATFAKQDKPNLVMIEEQENGKTLITIGGKYFYHFTRKTCITIVKELQDGEWHKMIKKPTPNFRNAEKTTTRIKKSQHGTTTEEMTTEGDHYKFSKNHLLSGGERKWRIVLHKSGKH